MHNIEYLTVEALTKYLKFKFDSDNHLKVVYLKGEISNFKAHSTGHFYFSLKDEYSKINAIMFSTHTRKILFTPSEGMNVLVRGRVSIYEATGNYQIYVEEMLEDGLGNLYVAFEQLKEKLYKEGLFDESKKLPIPKIPNRVGVITAKTGAAIKDIISTINRRFPICEIIVFPSLVQGENAASDIVSKIELAQNYNLDVLIVGRGGGSIEDLWPFNEEIVARAIFKSKIPVISAVGHETDFTISDFAADLRAPTPTGAAEMAVPNIIDLRHRLDQLVIRINENIYKKINFQKLYLDSIKNSFVIKNPMIMYENQQQRISNILEKINNIIDYKIEKNQTLVNNIKNNNILLNPTNLYKTHKIELNNIKNNNILLNPTNLYKTHKIELNNIISKLELLNPLSILKRGYTLTYINNDIIKSINDVDNESILSIRFHDGIVEAQVLKRRENYE